MKMTGDKWVAIWTVYCMSTISISMALNRPYTDLVTLYSVVIGAYGIHGTVRKGVALWKGRNEDTNISC